MDLESVILSEVSQTEREEYSTPYIWNLKINDTNKLTYRTETDSQTSRTNVPLPLLGVGENGGKGQSGSLGWTCTHCYI